MNFDYVEIIKRKEGENRAEQFKEQPLVDGEEFGSPEYDGRALMGDDEYKTFDDLSPEEAKEKLGHLVDKMDSNGDGDVDEKDGWIGGMVWLVSPGTFS